MIQKIKKIVEERLEEEIYELNHLKYRKSLGWKNMLPFYGIPQHPNFFDPLIEKQEKEVAEIKLLLK